MRPLTEEENKIFLKKLTEFIGANVKFLIERVDEEFVFRLIKDRVYYMSVRMMKVAQSIGREELLHAGILMGKFTKSKKFRLQVTCLDILAKYALHKLWLKPQGE